MSLTRRELLYTSAMAAGAALLPVQSLHAAQPDEQHGVTLLLNDNGHLARESAAGYRGALHGVGDAHTIIVPAISTLSWRTAAQLRRRAESGCSVILESAFMFTDSELAERQCKIVSDALGISMERRNERTAHATSYLQYRWPIEVLVRSFGQPLHIRNGDQYAIAHDSESIAAARKPMGRGQITFLGSPLGPLLLAGDREAMLLVRRMIAEPV